MSLFLMTSAVFGNKFKESDKMKDTRPKDSSRPKPTTRPIQTDDEILVTRCNVDQSRPVGRDTVRESLISIKLDTEKRSTSPSTKYESDLIHRFYGNRIHSPSTVPAQKQSSAPLPSKARRESLTPSINSSMSSTRPSAFLSDATKVRISDSESSSRRDMSKTTPTYPSKALKYNTTRYLPPPGPYYDQMELVRIFGIDAFPKRRDYCWTCWEPRHSDYTRCSRTCFVCGKSKHPGKCCPLLYCSEDWYRSRAPAALSFCQIRPSRDELDVLIRMALIHSSSLTERRVVPNMSHTLVEQFYRKARPQKLDRKGSFVSSISPKTSSSTPPPTVDPTASEHKVDKVEKTDQVENDFVLVDGVETLQKIDTSPTQDPGAFEYQDIFEEIQKTSKRLLEEIKHETPVSIHLGEPCYKDMLKWYMKKKGSEDYVEKLEQGVLELTVERHLMLREIRQLRGENELLRSTKDGHRLGEKRPLL